MARNSADGTSDTLARYLEGVDFPADREDILECAEEHDADDNVLETLGKLPDQQYNSMAEVMNSVGQGA